MCYRNPGLAFLLHFSSLLTAQITSQHLTTFTYSHTHSYTDGGACHARCDGPCMSVCAWTCCVVSEVGAGCSGDREDLIVVIGSTWAQCSTGYKSPASCQLLSLSDPDHICTLLVLLPFVYFTAQHPSHLHIHNIGPTLHVGIGSCGCPRLISKDNAQLRLPTDVCYAT